MPRTVLALILALLLVPIITLADEPSATRTANDGNVVLEGIPEIPAEIGEKLTRYQNTRSAGFQDWSADSTGIYLTTRFGETSQLHYVAAPGGARRQLTFFDEPVSSATRQPGGDRLGFMMDEGGGEFNQFFLLDPETGDHHRLTDGTSRNGAPTWSRDGARLAYQSTRRNGRSNDIWLMDVASADVASPEAARMIVESPDGTWWGPAEFSDDGEQLLVQQYISVTDSRVHLLDIDSGELKSLAGSEDSPSVNIAGGFGADGKGIFLITDAGSDYRQLAYMDLTTGLTATLTSDLDWDIGGFALSEDGKRGAFTVNVAGVDQLYLLDGISHAVRPVEGLPVGLIGGLEISPDGKRLGLTLNSARTPSDVFTLALAADPLDSGELVRWTWSEVGGLDTESFVEPSLIEYPTFDQVDGEARQIPAFLYAPEGPGPHPVLIYIHGGPESQYRPRFSSTFQLWIAEFGTAIIAPNVRGSSGYGKEYVTLDNGFLREESVKDIGALLDWIESRPDLDEKRVAVYGGSYGGYMVLASLVHYSDRLVAGIDNVGISNFVTFLENTQDYRRDLRRVEYGDERDPEMRAHLESISPGNHAAKITAPLFVVQGANDPRVPVTEADQIVREVRKAGHEVWYMKGLNEGHGFRKKENRDLFSEAAVLFLQGYLGDKAP